MRFIDQGGKLFKGDGEHIQEKALWENKTGWSVFCYRMMEMLLHGNDVINTIIIYANPKSDLYQVGFKLRRSCHAKCCESAV